jgi:3-mercaptopyruvate sulfurtransferase SseA
LATGHSITGTLRYRLTRPHPLPDFRTDLSRWQQLVTPRWLNQLHGGGVVRAAPPGRWMVLEVGCGAPDAFAQSHIPGAGYLDTRALEEAPFWNKVPDAALLQVLLSAGIAHDTTVIVYGRNMAATARAAHLMLFAGVRDVRLLDGGWQAWARADLPRAAGAPQALPSATEFGAPYPGCAQYLINLPQARALHARAGAALVSIRTYDEFVGKTSGYSYIHARGDIPGALWGHAGRNGDVNDMCDFHGPDGKLRPAAEICTLWQAEGIHPGLDLAFYCGTGWRASLAFFYAWLMGWDRISVFDGGWFEWSQPGA